MKKGRRKVRRRRRRRGGIEGGGREEINKHWWGSSLVACIFPSPPALLLLLSYTGRRHERPFVRHTHTLHGVFSLSVHTCVFSLVFSHSLFSLTLSSLSTTLSVSSLSVSLAPASPAPGVAAAAGACALAARTTCPIPRKPSTENARRPTSHLHRPFHSSARPSRLRLLRYPRSRPPYSPRAVAPCIELVAPPPACLVSRCTATAKTREARWRGGWGGEERGGGK